jgi:fructose-1,6-bisphosphatase II
MFNPGPSFYMDKLVVPSPARNVVDMNAPVADNLRNIAKALGKDVDDLVVFVLEKERHQRLINDIRAVGARIELHTDGDVAGALMAIDQSHPVDVLMGAGGTPEGVLAAIAIRIMGGEMFCRFDPQSEDEAKAVAEAGLSTTEIMTAADLAQSDDLFFAATGISGGTFLSGVHYSGNGAETHSLVMRGRTGTVRRVSSLHRWDKLMKISAIDYD